MGRGAAEVFICDECGFKWLPAVNEQGVVIEPKQCASGKCRSRKWNKGGVGKKPAAKKHHYPKKVKANLTAGPATVTGVECAPTIAEGRCPKCGEKLVSWGTWMRCVKCATNYPK